MTRRPLLEGFATLILIAAGTWLAGWWAVPILALIAGAAAIRPVFVAGAASLSWALLLVLDAAQGPFNRILSMLGGVMGLPGIALVILTLLFPALLAWAAATLGTLVSSGRPAPDAVHHPD